MFNSIRMTYIICDLHELNSLLTVFSIHKYFHVILYTNWSIRIFTYIVLFIFYCYSEASLICISYEVRQWCKVNKYNKILNSVPFTTKVSKMSEYQNEFSKSDFVDFQRLENYYLFYSGMNKMNVSIKKIPNWWISFTYQEERKANIRNFSINSHANQINIDRIKCLYFTINTNRIYR